jgi:hypothetical protein
MIECWEEDTEARPSFEQLSNYFHQLYHDKLNLFGNIMRFNGRKNDTIIAQPQPPNLPNNVRSEEILEQHSIIITEQSPVLQHKYENFDDSETLNYGNIQKN